MTLDSPLPPASPPSPAGEPEELLESLFPELSADAWVHARELAQLERLDRELLLGRSTVAGTLEALAGAVVERLPSARVAVATASPQGPDLAVGASRGFPAEALGVPLEWQAGPVGQTLRGGSPRAFPAGRFALSPDHFPEPGSVTVVPLLAQGDAPSGALLVFTPEASPLRGSDLEFLRRLGVHGAVLLENVRLFASLRASEETYRTIVERANLGMALLDPDGRIRHLNGPMREMVGAEAGARDLLLDRVAPEGRRLVQAQFDAGEETPPEPAHVDLLGSAGPVPARVLATPIRDPRGEVTGHVVIVRDRTQEIALENERQAMARRIHQAEKLSAVGKFVAGIAHELNNPLTVVIGYAELLTEASGLPARHKASLEQVLLHARRCGRIVEDLLKFAHHERTRPEAVDLASVVREAVAATSARAAGVDFEVELGPELPPITGSPHALRQVLTNILDNALDAVEHGAGEPAVRVSLRRRGSRQVVTVTDNGPGLSEPERVFDPFYTTKPIGKGTGLGLSICYGIVREHGGELTAENAPEGGAKLTIVLPEGPIEAGEDALAVLPGVGSGGASGRPEPEAGVHLPRLLVVDDEPAILTLAAESLDGVADVAIAETVEEAVRLLEAERFDAILTDFRMPSGLTGADFYEVLQDRWPRLVEHLAFMTGDTIGQATQAFLDRVRRPCLRKPFKLAQLVAFVEALVAPDEG